MGAEEMSRFHQLFEGKSGSGTVGRAPSTGVDAGHCASDAEVASRANAITNTICSSFGRMDASLSDGRSKYAFVIIRPATRRCNVHSKRISFDSNLSDTATLLVGPNSFGRSAERIGACE